MTTRAACCTPRDVVLAQRITAAVAGLGPACGPSGAGRPLQALEIAIDALDVDAVRPFWQAVLGYVVVDHPIAGGVEQIVVDRPARDRPCGSSRWMHRGRD